MGVACWIILLGFLTCANLGSALDCYNCANLRIHSSSSVLQSLLPGRIDSNCRQPSDETRRLSCPVACVLFHGTITATSLYGEISIEAHIRSCSLSSETAECQRAEVVSSELLALGQAELTWVPGLSDLIFSGDLCTCKSDKCLAECADDVFTLKLPLVNRAFCISWWMLCVAAVGLLALLSVIGACAWCCCCRKSNIHRDSLGRYVEKTKDKREIVILKK